MKKTYIIPETVVVHMLGENVIAVSGVQSDNGIGYGGTDEEGKKDPEVKRYHYNVWDNDWSRQ